MEGSWAANQDDDDTSLTGSNNTGARTPGALRAAEWEGWVDILGRGHVSASQTAVQQQCNGCSFLRFAHRCGVGPGRGDLPGEAAGRRGAGPPVDE